MPKYFKGTRELPREKIVSINYDDFAADRLQRKISEARGDRILSVKLPGLGDSCLGYIFFVSGDNNKYELRDVTGKRFFHDLTIERLEKIIKHASGIEYDGKIRDEFYTVRNDPGSDKEQ